MNFLEKLDLLMAEQNLNKSRLAQMSGVPYTTIDGLYKKGYENTKLSTIRKIASALNVSIDDLVEDAPEDEKSPGLSTEAMKIAHDYDILDSWGRKTVRAVTDAELARVNEGQGKVIEFPKQKPVPLFGNSFAAGWGEPDFARFWEEYEVPADSPAEFAIRITGDSMEPYIPDGSIALCRKTAPENGDVGAFLIDGEFVCKQVCVDYAGALHLFSLNRDRKDMDRHYQRDEIERQVICFGTVIMKKRIPLPLD